MIPFAEYDRVKKSGDLTPQVNLHTNAETTPPPTTPQVGYMLRNKDVRKAADKKSKGGQVLTPRKKRSADREYGMRHACSQRRKQQQQQRRRRDRPPEEAPSGELGAKAAADDIEANIQAAESQAGEDNDDTAIVTRVARYERKGEAAEGQQNGCREQTCREQPAQ